MNIVDFLQHIEREAGKAERLYIEKQEMESKRNTVPWRERLFSKAYNTASVEYDMVHFTDQYDLEKLFPDE